ncbi:MAG: hypothetical protein NXH84_08940 [Rhodobacteraceae bacterium]|nr:hypothetical protein [Paracoccaceae bacterium]
MKDMKNDLDALRARILDTPEDQRYLLQPELDRLIDRMQAAGLDVPATVRTLNEELSDEAIEAQFDNLPV